MYEPVVWPEVIQKEQLIDIIVNFFQLQNPNGTKYGSVLTVACSMFICLWLKYSSSIRGC